jgi:hypothetical protein
VSPGLAPAAGLAFELRQEQEIESSEGTEALFAMMLRASVDYGVGTASQGNVRMVLRLVMASLEACPLRVGKGIIQLSPCLRVEGGRQSGEVSPGGTGVVYGAWLAPGALARLTARVAGNVFVEGAAGVVVPLTRNRFFAGNSADYVYVSPTVAGRGDFSVGISFR